MKQDQRSRSWPQKTKLSQAESRLKHTDRYTEIMIWFWFSLQMSQEGLPKFSEIDRLSLSWAVIKFNTRPDRPDPWRNFSELNWHLFLAVLIPNWLYLNFRWSQCHETFRESPSKDPDHIQMKVKMPNPSQEQSGTSSILQSPKWWLKGHGCSLHLQNQDRQPKFGRWVYQRSVTICK